MNKEDIAILENDGWEIECESPFEISNDETESFATNEAAYAVLESLRPKDLDPRRVLWQLEPDVEHYMEKLVLLYSLIIDPNRWYVVSLKITTWCTAQGFKLDHRCEDKASWWVCGLK